MWDGKNWELGLGKLKTLESEEPEEPEETPTADGAGSSMRHCRRLALVAGLLLF